MTAPNRITRLYVWVMTDATGEDNIPAVLGSEGPVPLIAIDKAQAQSHRRFAEQLASEHGFPLRLVEFSRMVVLESLPAPAKPRHH